MTQNEATVNQFGDRLVSNGALPAWLQAILSALTSLLAGGCTTPASVKAAFKDEPIIMNIRLRRKLRQEGDIPPAMIQKAIDATVKTVLDSQDSELTSLMTIAQDSV